MLYKTIYTFSIITVLFSITAHAQIFITPASIETIKARSRWFSTKNAAGLATDNLGNFTQLDAGYQLQTGDFRRPQQGNESAIQLNAEGALKVNKTQLWGSFNYERNKQTETLYNSGIIDPFRGMPYYVADTNKSDWVKQTYLLRMKVASPLYWNRVRFGLDAEYHNVVSAKQVDPRAENYLYTFAIRPGFTLNYGRHVIGFNAEYLSRKEENSPSLSNNKINQTVYLLRGLGYSFQDVVGGIGGIGKRIFTANSGGGALQYAYSAQRIDLLSSVSYSIASDEAVESPTKPKKSGTTLDYNFNAKFLTNIHFNEKNLASINLSYIDRYLKGIEFVQELDQQYHVQEWITYSKNIRSTYKQKSFIAAFDFLNGHKSEYRWKAGFTTAYHKQNDMFYLPDSWKNIETIEYGINAKNNIHLSGKSRLLIGANVGYSNNLNGEYVYNGPDPNSPIIKGLMHQDMNYLLTDYFNAGAQLSYTLAINKGCINAGIFWNCFIPKNNDLVKGNRNTVMVKVGYAL